MITRSAKAAQARVSPISRPDSSTKTSRKRRLSPTDLEEELANPNREDYNQVRKALIGTRAVSEGRAVRLKESENALLEKDRLIQTQDAELKRCRDSYSEQIRQLQERVSELERKEEETKEDGEPVEPAPVENPVEEASTENNEAMDFESSIFGRLRAAIHEFAATYFGSRLPEPLQVEFGSGWADQIMKATTPRGDTYMDYLLSGRRCPLIVEAFIWRFLCSVIFDGVLWGGTEEIRLHMSELQKILGKFHDAPASTPEQLKTYQLWKMLTTKVVLELVDAGNVAHAAHHRGLMEQHLAQAISEVITPFIRASLDNHMSALVNIIHQAVDLDKEINRSLPRHSWAFSPGPIELPFDFSLEKDGIMKLVPGEKAAEKLPKGTRTKVYLVVAPGLRSRGRPEDDPSTTFEVEWWTFPMEVTCVKPRRQSRFSKSSLEVPLKTRTGTFSPSSDTTAAG